MATATATTVVVISYELHVREVYGYMQPAPISRIAWLFPEVLEGLTSFKAEDCLEYEAIHYQGLSGHAHPGCFWMQDAKCQSHTNPYDFKYLINPQGNCAG